MDKDRSKIYIFNSYSNKLEEFKPIDKNTVRMYLCGPTVYGLAHIGHAKSSITFDILNRYFKYLGYNVKFIRNYTDVGHLEHDADDTEDKIQKQAIKEHIEPMEIAQKYMNSYREDMAILNILPPNIEPQATSYINEQIENVKTILNKGFGYEINGSIYFDVKKYNEKFQKYGILSGRKIEDMMPETRELDNQNEKKNNIDFALWKKADSKHIMQWNSPWGYGYPGWHTECVVLSTKYLGELFDIHGGGYDLKFPHHEAELAQSNVIHNTNLANYWVHTNLVNIDGKKMSKSANNYITLKDLFFNTNNIFNKTFSPMDLRFLMLQTHYRSTLTITKDSLEAAHKGYIKLLNALKDIKNIEYKTEYTGSNNDINNIIEDNINDIFNELNNDINTPKVISNIFNLTKIINDIRNNNLAINNINKDTFLKMKDSFINVVENILAIQEPKIDKNIVNILLELYKNAKQKKDYIEVDFIRNKLYSIGIKFCDSKNNINFEYI